jgi:hypothetical protein
MANTVSNTSANTANNLPVGDVLNSGDALVIDQKVLEMVPLIVTEESVYTKDVTNKKEKK